MLWWFAETTLVAGLLACAAALLGRLRAIGPTARHLLWLVVLLKLLMPPVIRSPWPLPWPRGLGSAAGDPALAVATSHREASLPNPELGSRTSGISQDGVPVQGPAPARVPVAARVGTGGPAPAPRPERLTLRVEAEEARRQGWVLKPPDAASIRWWALLGWVTGAFALGLAQVSRILRFRGRLRDAEPVPHWLVEEAERMGARLGVQVPEVLAVAHLGTPMLWCLGPPKLLLPCHLIKSIEAGRWRGILAHELAHLGRGDHWVGRLELVAGLIWWWNPLYWLTRRRLDAEAELACDAWVVWALPDDRLSYAEVLFQICSEFSRASSPAPALGVAGSGRFFERRLTMILRDRVPCRISPSILLAACLLALLALPSWTLATPSALIVPEPESSAALASPSASPASNQVVADKDDGDDDDDDAMDEDDDAKAKADADDDDADDDDADDDDDQKAEKSRDRAAGSQKGKSKKPKGDKQDLDVDIDVDVSGIEKQIESALGPDFEKKIEQWAEKFAKEMESKFGENSEFAKKMEALGKEMEKKFGENSEFVKKMEALGKDMEKKFGPGSDFEKKMKALGEDMGKKFGPGSDFEKKIKAKADAKLAKTKAKPSETKDRPAASRGRAQKREQRVKALEARIDALMKELKALKEADDGDKDDDNDNDKKEDEGK
jgi:beta-lactamase regulating signal transducer with metallopeptidase domain